MKEIRMSDITRALYSLGYKIRIINPPNSKETLWQVKSDEGFVFTGNYHQFMTFCQDELAI